MQLEIEIKYKNAINNPEAMDCNDLLDFNFGIQLHNSLSIIVF